MKTRLIAFLAAALAASSAAIFSPADAVESTPPVTYTAHVQSYGWQAEAEEGQTAGTTGQARRLEALRIGVAGGATMRARAHVQKVGWQEWDTTPSEIGTTGRGLRLEAFQIEFLDKGQFYSDYDVEYRAHVQSIGWQPWVKNGATAGTTGRALRIEAVQVRLVAKTPPTPGCVWSGGGWLCYGTTPPTPTPTETPTPTPTPTETPTATSLAFTADIGMEAAGKATLDAIGASDLDATVALGDLAYKPGADIPELFCEQVNSRVETPFLLLAGNHEEMGSADGYIDDYAECLPAELPITGTYAREYFFDVDGVRVILVSPDIEFVGPDSRYGPGDAGRTFLENAIRDAKTKGMWTVVGMHHPCLTRGSHTCADTSPAVSDVALAEGVDLVLSGHNHNYERSHQIDGTTAAPVVVDSDSSMVKGAGTVFAVVGNAGHNPRAIGSKTSIWAVNNGTNSPGGFAYGYGQLRVTASELAFSHVSTGGATLNDTFVISR